MPEMVTGLAFTCDARALVAAGSDAALRMWDLTSGRVRHTLTGHVAKVLPPWGFRLVTSGCLTDPVRPDLRLLLPYPAWTRYQGARTVCRAEGCSHSRCSQFDLFLLAHQGYGCALINCKWGDAVRHGAIMVHHIVLSRIVRVLECLQVCSVDCSPMQPNQAVSGGTDRCIKVRQPLGRQA